jgi:mono/diheme cytochrome c family protein
MKKPTKLARILAPFASIAVLGAGCEGGLPNQDLTYTDTTTPAPAATLDERVYVDLGPIEGGIPLGGSVKNYLTGEYVAQTTVTLLGGNPEITGTADATGNYAIAEVPLGSIFWIKASKEGYAYTYDYLDATQPAASLTKNLYIVSQTSLDGLATAFGKTQNPSCGVIMATAKNANDIPQAGVTDPTLGAAVTAEGPYYLNATNGADVDAEETSATGKMVWFNVCDAGTLAVTAGKQASIVPNQGPYVGVAKSFNVYPGGVTVVNFRVEPANGYVPPPDPVPEVIIDFPTEIMPIFAQFQCSSCHAQGGQAGGTGLYFNVDPEAVYYTLKNDTQIVNIAYPAQSYLLTKPLYEEPPNHPNASWELDDPTYTKLLDWVEQGAPYGVNPPPPVDIEYDFAYDIYPIFANRGCTVCHGNVNPGGGMNLSLDAATVYQYILDNDLVNYDYSDRSPLLRNPYCGPEYCAQDQYPETHPTRVFYQTTDPDYVKIYEWIGQLEPVIEPVFNPYTNVDFVAQRHRFATYGCVRCHTKENYQANGYLKLVGTAQEVYDSLVDETNNPNAIVPGYYDQSNLFTKPNAYYPLVDHDGGKLVAGLDDAFARYFGGWILEDALFVAPAPRDFTTQIAPLFAAASLNCVGCHNATQLAGGMALDGTPAEIYAAITDAADPRVVPGYPAQSLILTKPCGGYQYNGQDRCIYDYNVVHTGPKRDIAQYYNEFQYLADWISEGAYEVPQ